MLTVYKASAGSGKTYTLAQTYITHLLGIKNHDTKEYSINLTADNLPIRDNQHRHILAITFTRKATEEMKTRIVKELKALTIIPAPGQDDSPYVPFLREKLHCADRGKIAKAAANALQQLLFDYKNFNVSTIDAFFQKVLHSFARELDRQGDYDIELDDENAMKSAVGLMLDHFNNAPAGGPLEQWIYNLMLSAINNGTKANFFNRQSKMHTDLIKEISRISLESFKPHAQALREYLKTDALNEFIKRYEKKLNSIAEEVKKEAVAVFDGIDIEIPKLFTVGIVSAIKNYFLRGKVMYSWSDFLKTDTGKNIVNPDCDKWESTNKEKLAPEQIAGIKDFMVRTYQRYQTIISLSPLKDALNQLGLLQHAWEYLTRYVEENNLLLISDTNELLSRIIEGEETPFVYERMGVQLRHFLIDEFQDTSHMQWDNLYPLLLNGLGGDNDSLVIGDEKQSIYRFRNSDSQILHHQVKDKFKERVTERGTTPKENTNHRSSADVVRFNNTFFSIMAQQKGIRGFENVVQDIKPQYRDWHGHVSFHKYEKDENLDEMLDEINRLTTTGKYDYRDIAILTSTNTDAKKIVNYLIADGSIPVLSDEALLLRSSWAVRLIISMLRMLDKEVPANLKETIKEEKPEEEMTPVERKEKARRERFQKQTEMQMSLNRAQYFLCQTDLPSDQALSLATDPNADSLLSIGLQEIQRRNPASLSALVETIIAVQLTEQTRTEQSAYLAALQDVVADFSRNGYNSLHAFLDWWDTKSDKLAIGGDAHANAVKVMTIHKSKGLEFPCVLIPYCNWPVTWDKKKPKVWTSALKENGLWDIPNELIPPVVYIEINDTATSPDTPFYDIYQQEYTEALVDTANKTYVAFTRAECELLVWYKKNAIGEVITNVMKQGMSNESDGDGSLLTDLREHYNPTTGAYELGEPTVKKDHDKQNPQKEEPLTIGYRAICRPDAISMTQIDDPRELDKSIDDDPRSALLKQEGTIMHDIMAMIRRAEDLDSALKTAQRRYRIDQDRIDEYRLYLDHFINNGSPLTRRWWSDYEQLFIEQPIYIPNIDEMRRPDRVMAYADGSADVIDYKFTTDPSHVGLQDHIDQVQLYMRLLHEMGYNKVRGYLCYPLMNEMLEV